MAMYALAVSPLIKDLKNCNTKQVWYADDSSAGGRLNNLKAWWELLVERGPAYGYFANPDKSWLVVKEDKYNEAKEIFHNTNLNITKEGRRCLGSALENDSFLEAFVRNKVAGWVKEIETLSEFYKNPTTCFLCGVHPPYFAQMELHIKNYTWNLRVASTCGRSYPVSPTPIIHWTRCLQPLGEETHSSASSPRRIRNP